MFCNILFTSKYYFTRFFHSLLLLFIFIISVDFSILFRLSVLFQLIFHPLPFIRIISDDFSILFFRLSVLFHMIFPFSSVHPGVTAKCLQSRYWSSIEYSDFRFFLLIKITLLEYLCFEVYHNICICFQCHFFLFLFSSLSYFFLEWFMEYKKKTDIDYVSRSNTYSFRNK